MMNGELCDMLKSERDNLLGRLEALSDEIRRLGSERESLSNRLSHIHGLLGDEEGLEDGGKGDAASPTKFRTHDEDPVEIAYAVLGEAEGKTLHYRNLAALVRERGGELPGTDPASTLVSRLVRDGRFVRPHRRGWYALHANYPNAKSVGERKKKSRR